MRHSKYRPKTSDILFHYISLRSRTLFKKKKKKNVPERKIKGFLFLLVSVCLSTKQTICPFHLCFFLLFSLFFFFNSSLPDVNIWVAGPSHFPAFDGNLSSQRCSSNLQMDFPLLANWSPETQFTGPGKGSWQDSWTVWFWSLRELEKPPSFMLGLLPSAMHHLDTSPLVAPLCLARVSGRARTVPTVRPSSACVVIVSS